MAAATSDLGTVDLGTVDLGTVDLGNLGLEEGGHLLVKHALRQVPAAGEVTVRGSAPDLLLHLRVWCRQQGHVFLEPEAPAAGGAVPAVARIRRGSADAVRVRGAEPSGLADPALPGAVHDHPPGRWGLAARGATIEAGTPEFHFPLADRTVVWADEAARFYAQAVASQWDPAVAIPWDADFTLPDEIEDAVVQVMTYLVENETAALLVPARFLAQVHPHFREILQVLAVQAADEARHIEVFVKRAMLHRNTLGLSTAGGQASLKTLLDEPDFALAFFLLSVLGEGSFLPLLEFLARHAPDPITREVTRLASVDEARHVAFGMAHLQRHLEHEPGLHARLAAAIERRHDALRQTSGLNEEVFDALVLLAAGSWQPDAIRAGFGAVAALEQEMAQGRERRLRRLGFGGEDARTLSALHTRNFM